MPPVIMFDLDQTLAESKQALTDEMGTLIGRLLTKTKVAVISGGALPQFEKQVVAKLPPDARIANFYILPTSGAALYEWRAGQWHKVYEESLTKDENTYIGKAIRTALKETQVVDLRVEPHGERIEYRGSEVSFSALGQEAPPEEKKKWDPDKSKRRVLQRALATLLPNFSVGMGGSTTIDITRKGVDKAYGIQRLSEHLKVPVADMMYVGDQLEPGGNDEPALRTNIKTHAVKDPSETAFFIQKLLTN